jgi:hypothetical protein
MARGRVEGAGSIIVQCAETGSCIVMPCGIVVQRAFTNRCITIAGSVGEQCKMTEGSIGAAGGIALQCFLANGCIPGSCGIEQSYAKPPVGIPGAVVDKARRNVAHPDPQWLVIERA